MSWHSSFPCSTTQPLPQISTGSFSHFVSPTNFPEDRLLSRYWEMKMWFSWYSCPFTHLCGTVCLIHCPALLLPLTITDLDLGSVALPHGVPDGLLPKGDLTRLLKVFLTLLLLAGNELGDVGVVTLLDVPVSALKHGLFGQTLHRVLFDHAQSPVLRPRSLTEIDTAEKETNIVLFIFNSSLKFIPCTLWLFLAAFPTLALFAFFCCLSDWSSTMSDNNEINEDCCLGEVVLSFMAEIIAGITVDIGKLSMSSSSMVSSPGVILLLTSLSVIVVCCLCGSEDRGISMGTGGFETEWSSSITGRNKKASSWESLASGRDNILGANEGWGGSNELCEDITSDDGCCRVAPRDPSDSPGLLTEVRIRLWLVSVSLLCWPPPERIARILSKFDGWNPSAFELKSLKLRNWESFWFLI